MNIKLFKFLDIEVSIHFSTIIFLIVLLLFNFVVFYITTLMYIFVLIHEYGHCLAALHYNYETKGIVLYPIGGVAFINSRFLNPKEELVIALAGPLTNLVIALAHTIVISLYVAITTTPNNDVLIALITIASINYCLFVFNMLPIFPMDGGRILRAILCFFADRYKSTLYTVVVGILIALPLCTFAIMNGIYLVSFTLTIVLMMSMIELSKSSFEQRMINMVKDICPNPKNFYFTDENTMIVTGEKCSIAIDLKEKSA